MNKSERLMNERMTWRTGRGRGSVEIQRVDWLRTIRAERSKNDLPKWTIYCPLGWMNFRGTFRRAKFEALRMVEQYKYENGDFLRAWIVDQNTKIQVWENYSTNN